MFVCAFVCALGCASVCVCICLGWWSRGNAPGFYTHTKLTHRHCHSLSLEQMQMNVGSFPFVALRQYRILLLFVFLVDREQTARR